MKRTGLYVVGVVAVAAILVLSFAVRRGAASPPEPQGTVTPELVAGPGRVEPVSEEVNLGADVSGRLQEVLVEEGDRVTRGQIVAVFDNADYQARVALAEAELALREAELRRVRNGARTQERREALAEVHAAAAVEENARIEQKRRTTGYEQGVFPKEDADRAEREFGVAQARHAAARERYALLEAGEREEDHRRAEAQVALAAARLAEARALLSKTIIRSPLSGIVLRKNLKAGEIFSHQREASILTLGDAAVLRVRMDVDESDVGRVQTGQQAYVTADAYPGKRFPGRVLRVGQLLGKKNVRTDEPAERVDTKVLETLIELEPGSNLPPGLRVDAFIVARERK
jgi:HlyD family secretion protein